MKIKKIELKGYNQFKNLEIDLTYPQGHTKEGKPLDKVCIVGQSGTGKTSLLRLIKWFVSRDRNIDGNLKLPLPPDNSIYMDVQLRGDLDLKIFYHANELKYADKSKEYISSDPAKIFPSFEHELAKIKPLLINYPADMFNGMGIKNENGDGLTALRELELKQIIDFNFEDIGRVWLYILKDIKDHLAQELVFTKQIAEVASRTSFQVEEVEKKTKEYKEWMAANPSPLKILAEKCLDPLLYNIGLKTKTDIDKNTILNLGFIELQTLFGAELPHGFWSTGTRQLVQTMIPLFQLKPKNAIILMDEPERSLYPDIQRSIINAYVKLAPKCQFFFATHSPIIASAFEPWEIVELKFDKENKYAYRELYFDGDNHVDNYKYHPEYLRWDSILRHIFDMEQEGNKKRKDALEELTELMSRIGKLKEKAELDTSEGKELVDRYLALGVKLDWRIQGAE
ncbi:MAG: AAA family ATPase [Candidatus Aminicenantes bacterium]|nr:AAA family ATPase [Candidatus Aminicenantes bacterium]